jgi:hypothetical protein
MSLIFATEPVLVVRNDEAHHRDINHRFADELGPVPAIPLDVAPYPICCATIRMRERDNQGERDFPGLS